MNRLSGRLNRLEENVDFIKQRKNYFILTDQERKIAMEVTRRYTRWVLDQLGLGRNEADFQSEVETTRVCKNIYKGIQDELKNGSLKLD